MSKTLSRCAMNACSDFPVCVSHSRTVLSSPPLTNRDPSGLNATLVISPICPSNVRRCFPVCTSQSRTVWSSLALTIVFPSGLNVTSVVLSLCPCSVQSSVPVFTFQTRTVPSMLALANRVSSGLNATFKTQSVCPVSRLSGVSVSVSYIQIPMLHATDKRFHRGNWRNFLLSCLYRTALLHLRVSAASSNPACLVRWCLVKQRISLTQSLK